MFNLQIMNKQCIICESADCQIFPNKFFKNVLWRCRKCGLIFVHPQPASLEIKKIYSQNYFQNANSHSIGYENYLADKSNIIKTFEKRFRDIEKLYPNKGNVLDLGCALGFFLEVAENYGWTPYGVEISDYASTLAQRRFGDKIVQDTLDRACFPNNLFDIITMWDYLEHISNPSQELARVWQLLKKGGMLILSTPDTDSLPHKIFRDRWMGYKDQEHLYYFSKKNAIMLLERTGFKVLKSERMGKYVSLSLFIKRLNLYNKFLANLIRLLLSKKIINSPNLSFYVNPLDIICIYAKK